MSGQQESTKMQMDPVTAVAISQEHYYTIATLFVIGYLLHAAIQIDALARSDMNQFKERWVIAEQNMFRLASRFFVSLMSFLFLWHYPAMVPKIVTMLGFNLSENAIAVMTIPMNPPVAGMMGFAVDTLLTYVPWLKNQLPPIEFTKIVKTTQKTTVEQTHSVQQIPTPEGTDDGTTKVVETNVKETTNVPKP